MRKDKEWNVVYASKTYSSEEIVRDRFACSNLSWLQKPTMDMPLYCKVRHGPDLYQCELVGKENDIVGVKLDRHDQGLAPGQYAVFYQDGVCIGYGVIEACCENWS